jgi:protein-S-isoprenylcysteine O-methyltransferase Ste14
MNDGKSSTLKQAVQCTLSTLRVRREARYAIAFGLVTHVVFAISVGAMIFGLYSGLRTGHGHLHGWYAVLGDALLIIQFPVIHSFLLSKRGRSVLAKLAPGNIGGDLAPTTYVFAASLQLLATFELWSPSGITLVDPSGGARWLFIALFVASWLFLIKALTDSGLALQTGYIGWSSVLHGKRPDYGDFPKQGLFRMIRHPVYLGFALVLWTAPVHTLDGVLLASIWTVYCVIGPLFKESRFLKWHGERYARYRAMVPYMFPRSRSR